MTPPPPDPDALDRLRALILASPSLQIRLGAIEDMDQFATAVTAVAAGEGVSLDAAAVRTALRMDPVRTSRFDGAPPNMLGWPAPGWRPESVVPTGGELALDWVWFGDATLDEPFYTDSLRRAQLWPLNRFVRVRTRLAALATAAPAQLAIPAGLVFHWSRCGSTLVAQMAAAVAGTTVVSEAPALDDVVRLTQWHTDVPEAERIALLRAIVGALGRGADGMPGRLIVKLDSWHTLALPLLRRAFPDTPWLFLFRDPLEVLVSQHRMRGVQTVPGGLGGLLGIEGAEEMSTDEHLSAVLERIGEAVLEHWPLGGGLALDYAALPKAVETIIFPHLGVETRASDAPALAAAQARDAKNPDQSFTPDSQEKQASAGGATRAVAARLAPLYRRLQALAAG